MFIQYFLCALLFCAEIPDTQKIQKMNSFGIGVWYTELEQLVVVGFNDNEEIARRHSNLLLQYMGNSLSVRRLTVKETPYDWLDGENSGGFFYHDGLCSFVPAKSQDELITKYETRLEKFKKDYSKVETSMQPKNEIHRLFPFYPYFKKEEAEEKVKADRYICTARIESFLDSNFYGALRQWSIFENIPKDVWTEVCKTFDITEKFVALDYEKRLKHLKGAYDTSLEYLTGIIKKNTDNNFLTNIALERCETITYVYEKIVNIMSAASENFAASLRQGEFVDRINELFNEEQERDSIYRSLQAQVIVSAENLVAQVNDLNSKTRLAMNQLALHLSVDLAPCASQVTTDPMSPLYDRLARLKQSQQNPQILFKDWIIKFGKTPENSSLHECSDDLSYFDLTQPQPQPHQIDMYESNSRNGIEAEEKGVFSLLYKLLTSINSLKNSYSKESETVVSNGFEACKKEYGRVPHYTPLTEEEMARLTCMIEKDRCRNEGIIRKNHLNRIWSYLEQSADAGFFNCDARHEWNPNTKEFVGTATPEEYKIMFDCAYYAKPSNRFYDLNVPVNMVLRMTPPQIQAAVCLLKYRAIPLTRAKELMEADHEIVLEQLSNARSRYDMLIAPLILRHTSSLLPLNRRLLANQPNPQDAPDVKTGKLESIKTCQQKMGSALDQFRCASETFLSRLDELPKLATMKQLLDFYENCKTERILTSAPISPTVL
ncbi:MAG: hypothetical protein AAB323_02110 [Pseudomonadota bacterium]